MKKILLILLTIISLNASSQLAYHPFPDSCIVWRENFNGLGFNCACSGLVCLHDEQYQYFLNGDTIIGLYSYHKIYKTGNAVDYITGPMQCPPNVSNYAPYYFNDVYVGGLREDTAQHKVYFFDALNGQDTLLYDFNLTTGDTLPLTYNNLSNYVLSIDSVSVGNDYHRRYNLAQLGNTVSHVSIIEGIGSTFGLLYSLVLSFEFLNQLQCVTVNAITVYPDTVTICPLNAGINENEFENIFSIAPNPFSESSIIILSEKFENSELKIYNSTGDLVFDKIVQGNSLRLGRENFSSGIYILKAINSKGQIAIAKISVE